MKKYVNTQEHRIFFLSSRVETSTIGQECNFFLLSDYLPICFDQYWSVFYRLPAPTSGSLLIRPSSSSWLLGDIFRGFNGSGSLYFFYRLQLPRNRPGSRLSLSNTVFDNSLNYVITNWPPLNQCAVHVPKFFYVLRNEEKTTTENLISNRLKMYLV